MWEAAVFSSNVAGETVELTHVQPVQELFEWLENPKTFCLLLNPISAYIVEFMKCSIGPDMPAVQECHAAITRSCLF